MEIEATTLAQVSADPLADLFEEDVDREGDWSEVLGDLRDGGGAVSDSTAVSSSLALVPSSRPGATTMDPFTCTLIQSSPTPPPPPTYPPSPSPTHLPVIEETELVRVSLRRFGSGVPPFLSGLISLFLRSSVDSRDSWPVPAPLEPVWLPGYHHT